MVTIFLMRAFGDRREVVSFALRGHYAELEEELLVGNLIAVEILQLIVLICIASRPDVLRLSLIRTRRNDRIAPRQ